MISLNYSLKGAQSALSGRYRVNWSAKTWMGNCPPCPPISYVPACFLGLMDSEVVQKIRVHTYSKWSCQYQFQTWILNPNLKMKVHNFLHFLFLKVKIDIFIKNECSYDVHKIQIQPPEKFLISPWFVIICS